VLRFKPVDVVEILIQQPDPADKPVSRICIHQIIDINGLMRAVKAPDAHMKDAALVIVAVIIRGKGAVFERRQIFTVQRYARTCAVWPCLNAHYSGLLDSYFTAGRKVLARPVCGSLTDPDLQALFG